MMTYHTIYFDDVPQAGRALDIWIPPGGERRNHVLFFIHGGGWRQGHRENMHAIMHGFYKAGYICAATDYRLGKATVPMQLSDVREALAIADAYLKERGISLPFALYGSSAGGHLALLAGLAAPGACGDDGQGAEVRISGVVASCAPVTFEPWEDIFPGSWESMQEAAGVPYAEQPERYRLYSPAYYVSEKSPPLFFLLGECEHMFPNTLTCALVEKVTVAGGKAECRTYPAAEHGFFYDLHRTNQKMAFRDILAFLEEV